jgi:large subunit ribosomal protein L22
MLIATLVRGKSVNAALEQLRFVNRRASALFAKVIESAVANARQGGVSDLNGLFVKTAMANEGPLKQRRMRFRPGPQGRARPIRKRTSHLIVVLGVSETARKPRARRAAKGADSASKTSKGN